MLCIMMFFNFFIWGIWFITMGPYLSKGDIHASGAEVAQAYATQSWGAIIAPFIIGMIADKYFSAQKILGFLHICGAILLFFISKVQSFENFYLMLLVYMILYMPSLSLTNAVALNQMNNSEKEFSFIRMWGTIGWIVQGLIVGYLLSKYFGFDIINDITKQNNLSFTFKIASIISLFFGVFCYFLPDTPPNNKGKKTTISELLGLESLALLKNKNYLVFFVSSILICIPLAFYYSFAGQFFGEINFSDYAKKMTFGQMSETLFLFIMPWFFTRLKVKKMLLLGMFSWALRYFFFSAGNINDLIWMLYGGIILHGICYDFFFVTGYIYTDQIAGEKIRASAQGFITIATYGLGMLIGFKLSGIIVDKYTVMDPTGNVVAHLWNKIWIWPASIAAAILVLFFIFFKEQKTNNKATVSHH